MQQHVSKAKPNVPPLQPSHPSVSKVTEPASKATDVFDHPLSTTLVWALVVVVALVLFRKHIRKLVDALAWRLRSGAPIKIGGLEFPAEEARPDYITTKDAKKRGVRADDGARRKEREDYYAEKRRVMLVHRLLRSNEPGELYDIVIYLLPSYKGTLGSVQSVEYYFGGYGWEHKIFPASDRANGFPVVTAAYGPFLCTAEVIFTDGYRTVLHRFIDFEMGDYAPLSPLHDVPLGESE